MDLIMPITQISHTLLTASSPELLQPPLPPDLTGGATTSLPQVSAPVAERFADMMSHSRLVVAQPGGSSDSGALISELLRNEDIAMQYVSNDMLYMLEHGNSMTMGQLTTASMQVQIEAASLQVDMQAKMSVVTSSKDAIETLMKNQ